MQDWYNDLVRFYDAENWALTDDLALYDALLAEVGGPVLDVGCGTGRVALHLGGQARVVGLDVSADMLAYARQKLAGRADLARNITLLETNVADFESREPAGFGLAVVAYNGFMHLCWPADQLAALRSIARALREDGRLVIDLPNATDAYGMADPPGLVYERTFTDPETGYTVMQQSLSHLERSTQTLSVTWVYDMIDAEGVLRRTMVPVSLRYVFPAEMDLLLAQAGLERVQFYGDYDRSPFMDGAPRMIVLARPAPA